MLVREDSEELSQALFDTTIGIPTTKFVIRYESDRTNVSDSRNALDPEEFRYFVTHRETHNHCILWIATRPYICQARTANPDL